MKPKETSIELPEQTRFVTVSEFGAWMRRAILVLLICLMALVVWALLQISTLNDLVDSNSTTRSKQLCAMLSLNLSNPTVQTAFDETCRK